MAKNKIVDIQDFKSRKALKEQIKTLDDMQYEYIEQERDPVIRKGYINFMRFLKLLDAKYDNDGQE
jgi:hypothetical protein